MIIFNCLPPSPINMPSAGLSILTAYLKDHDIKAETIYWNLLLFKALENEMNLPGSSAFPLLIHLLGALKGKPNPESIAYLKRVFPDSYNSTKKVDEATNFLFEYIGTMISMILAENTDENPLYIGFQIKHDQWVSSLSFSALIKKISRSVPEAGTPIVLAGSFARREAAEAYLKIDRNTDFCFWGESEDSLHDFLKNNNPDATVIKPGRLHDKDFRERIFPDYSGYFKAARETGIPAPEDIQLPIEGVRGCHWNRCKFCIATRGIKYSERSPESMAEEIVMQNRKYGIGRFYFTDDDTTGGTEERIKALCSSLGNLHKESGGRISYTAWINPSGMRLDYYRKLRDAGFTCLKTGHESDNDSLLEKMDKRSRFADNILFMKAASIFGIEHQGGIPIIMGIPGESEEDLIESMDNLRFLRFYLNPVTCHGYNQFDLGKGSRFYREMAAEEKKNYNINLLGKLLPEDLLEGMDEDFLQYKRESLVNAAFWQEFKNREANIRDSGYSYSFAGKTGGSLLFQEGCKDRGIIKKVKLSIPEQDILKQAEDRIVSLEEICSIAQNITGGQEPRELSYRLREQGLLYISKDETQCVSVIMLPEPQSS